MILCYSVRLESLISISDKACLAISFDGSKDIIPKSQIFGQDWEVIKSQSYWISAWILEKKNVQYSTKKKCYFDEKTGNMIDEITKHKPIKKDVIKDNSIIELKKEIKC